MSSADDLLGTAQKPQPHFAVIALNLEPQIIRKVDMLAMGAGVTRSWLMRQLLKEFVGSARPESALANFVYAAQREHRAA